MQHVDRRPDTPEVRQQQPALRVLVLAFAVAAAQTPVAAWAGLAGLACLALGWLAHRRRAARPASRPRGPGVRAAAMPSQPLARRRADAAGGTPPPKPLLAAHRDTLTELPALPQLHDEVLAWGDDLRARGHALCVLRVALDGLPPVVERYGREAGEEVLRQIAQRLRRVARADDRVLRLPADEVAHEVALLLACPEREYAEFVPLVSARIKAELARPLAYRTLSSLRVDGRVAAGVWPLHGASIDDVLEHTAQNLARMRPRVPEALAVA